MKKFRELLEKGSKMVDELEQQTGFLIEDIEFYIDEGESVVKKIPATSNAHKKLIADFKKFKNSLEAFVKTATK